MENRRKVEKAWKMSEAPKVKVMADSVKITKEKGGCKQNCLEDVNEKYILDHEYMK